MSERLSVSGLDSHLGYWLRLVSNHVSQAFAARLAARDVTVAEWVTLRALYDQPPMPPSRLAEAMGMSRGAITKLASRLIAKALLVREDDPDDGRAQTLALTAAGRALVPQLARLADENDDAFFAPLSAAERGVLEGLLRRLAQSGGMSRPPTD